MAGDDTKEENPVRVPVVDIGALMASEDAAQVAAILRDGASDIGETLEALRAALTEWGFFYISNHGIAPEHMADFQRQMKQFFALSDEIKATIRRTAANPFGYFDEEFTKNKKDWKEVFGFTPRYDNSDDIYAQANAGRSKDVENQWVDDQVLPGFKSTLTDYYYRVEHIAQRLLMLIAVTLGEDVTFFDQFFCNKGKDATTGVSHKDNNTSSMRLNHYPIAPEPEKTMGVHHHTDPGALTVLLQDESVTSLQVFHRATQQWQFVPPVKDTFVINIGDMIQVWSNDKYAAPMHRVLANSATSRYSAPFFHNPAFDANIRPLLVDANDTPKYRELNWKSYIFEKVKGDFANLDEEDPHISQYRIQESEAA